MKRLLVVIISICMIIALAACGESKAQLQDGTYEGKSEPDSRGGYGVVKIEVKDGKITSAEFLQYNSDGSLKDESYGKDAGEENYKKAQAALEAAGKYAEKLVETQDVDKVDAITGATSSWNTFKEAANNAIAQAKGNK